MQLVDGLHQLEVMLNGVMQLVRELVLVGCELVDARGELAVIAGCMQRLVIVGCELGDQVVIVGCSQRLLIVGCELVDGIGEQVQIVVKPVQSL
jgi:hypothetical protein